MTFTDLFAPGAWGLGGARVRRAATALLLCVLTMTVQTARAQWSGSGTEADPYKITSTSDLDALATNVNSGTTYENTYFRLENNIEYGGGSTTSTNFTPIGNNTYDHTFRGNFNGNHMTISGVRVYRNGGNDDYSFVGIFGATYGKAEIYDLTVSDAVFTGYRYVGGIVGFQRGGTVTRCTVTSSVYIYAPDSDGAQWHGGISGSNSGKVTNCVSSATLRMGNAYAQHCYGGIVGQNYGTVSGCLAEGADVPNATTYYGAICGKNESSGSTSGNYYRNCKVNGTATANGFGLQGADVSGQAEPGIIVSGITTNFTVSPVALTIGGHDYFAANSELTIGTGDVNKVFVTFTATGATATSLSADKTTATVTLGTANVTVSATVKTIGGTTEDGLTWSLGGTNYTELTIGGTGPMQNYQYTTGNVWKTKAPWGTDITSVTIGDGVTSIGDFAFIGCENVASVTIGSGVTSIGIGAINHCDQMTTVTLPASVTTIAYAAFENCQKLETVYINHDGEVSLTGSHDNAFNAPLLQYIAFSSPAGALANTKESGNWVRYKDNIRARFGNQLFTATNEGGTPAYAITNESDLRNLAAAVNAGNDGNGKTFRQTLDITMTGGNFTPIGTNMFCGTYDGGNHDIIGLTISKEYGNIGLFGRIWGAAHLHDITLVSPTVTAATMSYSIDLGAVVGLCEGDKPVVENCHVINPTVSATSSGTKHVGAIIGTIWSKDATVTNCYFYDSNTDHNYPAYGYNRYWQASITNVGRAYAVNIVSSGVEATGNGFTHGTDRYLTGTVTLSGGTPHTNGGWVDTYTVNGTAIEGNTFSLTADATVAYSSTPDATHFAETGTNEYTIYDATGWDVFCDLLEENDQGYFTGKTVVLDNDIAVTRMAGSTNHEFSGTFDGQKHTLTVAITGTVQGTAPFCEIKGATIRNLAVTGSVAGKRHSAGLVGFARGDNSVTNTIENCLVNTSISITGDDLGYMGGIVGHGFTSALTIRGCAFTGSLTSTSNYTGGLQGWSDGNILTLQDDLFAPTSVSAANAGFHPVAFHNNNKTTTATVSNVYYTVAPTCTQASRIATANAAEQPKLQRNITAGENVTIEAISPVGSSTANYTTSGITAYAKGITRGSTFYYGNGDAVSLTLTNTPPEGYGFGGYTASPDGATLTEDGDNYTLTMSDADVTIGATFIAPVNYIDENGVEQTLQPGEYTVLTGGGETTLAGGWYVVNSDITYTGTITLDGDAHIILCDGAEMSINANGYFINGFDYSWSPNDLSLSIYSQSLGSDMGKLNVSGTGEDDGIFVKNLTVNGGNISIDANQYRYVIDAEDVIINRGNVSVNAQSNDYITVITGHDVTINGGNVTVTGGHEGLHASNNLTINGGTVTATGSEYGAGIIAYNDITINGGQVEATGCSYGIFSNQGTITLGWTAATDRITANSYDSNNGNVTIAQGQMLCDEDSNIYSGTIEWDKTTWSYPIDGKTLRPCILVTEGAANDYSDRTSALTPWAGQDMTAAFQRTFNVGKASTICLPFPMTAVTGGTVYGFVGVTYDETDGWVATMQEPSTTPLTANTPYLFMPSGDNETVDVTFSGSLADVTSIAAGETEAATEDDTWTFQGTYSRLAYGTAPFSGKAFGFAAKSKGEGEDAVQAGEFVRAATGATIPAFRAFLTYTGDETSLQARATRGSGAGVPDRIAVRLIDRNGETQGIGEIRLSTGEVTFDSDAWYDLNGRRLAGKPTQQGIYINGGHKVVIKN